MTALRILARPVHVARFLLYYVGNLVLANLLVAWEVLTPRHGISPAVVRVPMRCETDLEISGLANLISFTPGTLTLEIADDRSALFVHALHVRSADRTRARIGALETRWLELVR